MAASVPPNPRLGKSQALNVAQSTTTRLTSLVPSLTTDLSPLSVYQPGPSDGVGSALTAAGGANPVDVSAAYGVWVAPDLNGDGSEYYVQVECFGGGGGAGGGSSAAGGGGGGGAEYSCETQYPVKPGESYAYVVGLPGTGGANNNPSQVNPGAAGTDGGLTIFDIAGLGLANGVVANGGQGGDQTAIGIGGAGGTGSSNAIHFDGGNGGTNSGSHASDNPLSLAQVSGYFVGNTLSQSIIPAWYMLNETGPTGGNFNDNSLHGRTGGITNFTGGYALAQTVTPTQVPAFAAVASPPLLPVAQAAGLCGRFQLGTLTSPSAKITAPAFTFSGTRLSVSAWIQPDPSGTWGNTATGAFAVIAANTQNYNGNAMTGYALFLVNTGTPSAPNWTVNAAVGNGSRQTIVSGSLPPTVGTWHQVVLTYNAGTLTLYVDGSSVGTAVSSGYTSVPGGGFASTIAMDPNASANWFFGSIASVWLASDCITSAGVSAAFGLSVVTGGAGGGASGGPSAAGGTGGSASGSTGGSTGTPATQPASLVNTTTEAMSGYPGANGGTGFEMRSRLGVSYTTVTKTASGTYTQELPQGVSVITGAAAWGAGSGGAGGSTSGGGSGGAGGEYAAEAVYSPSVNPFTYVVGSGGNNSSTGAGNGAAGGDSFIDSITGVHANGATATAGGSGSTNTTHHNGGGPGTTTSTGAGSGGNSGNSSASGDVGGSTTNSIGAASPAAQAGSGRGGAGGSNNNNGSNGGSPGAGGGGAGAGVSGSTTLTKTYEAVYTAAYYGPDASGGNANTLRSTSVLWQGGETSGGGEFNGNQRSVMVFNVNQIADDFAGYTATGLTLKLVNTHSWFNSGMSVEFDVGKSGAEYPSSAPGSWKGDYTEVVTGTIAENGTGNFGLGAGVAALFVNNQTNFLAIGGNVPSKHAYNLNYYGSFVGGHGTSVEITITGSKTSSGSNSSGFGSDGQVSFTYADSAPFVPPVGTTGGPYGGGGGASGNMTASPALQVLTVPFSTAAAYCGIDALGNAAAPYSVNLQNNPASRLNTVLFAGGQAADAGSGTKNSMLLLPPTLAAALGDNQYTIHQVFLTFTNANPAATTPSILEVGYSSDTTLPQIYFGTSLISYIAAVPIAVGDTTITYDMSQSGIGELLQSGAATALILGPGADPTFDAYNSPSGPDFFCSIYGPGAADSFGNPQFPYLTIVLQQTETVQAGSTGNGGAILITAIDNHNTPVATIQPYATADVDGNQFAQGYTGLVTAFDPTEVTPGNFVPESWKQVTLAGNWSASGNGISGFFYRLTAQGDLHIVFDITTTSSVGNVNTVPILSEYWPATNVQFDIGHGNSGTPGSYTAGFAPSFKLTTAGIFDQQSFNGISGNLNVFGSILIPLGSI